MRENKVRSKVYFIYPPSPVMNREDRCQQPTDDLIVIPPLPPLDLMYMAAMAQKCGYNAKIKDYSLSEENIENLIHDIRVYQPDYIVMNVTTPTLDSDLSVCSKIKKELPDVIIIAKGAHFSVYDIQVLEKYPELDVIIRGEPELTLKAILSNWEPYEIMGITHRLDGKIERNIDRPFNNKLDNLPFPARDLIDNSIYTRPDTGEIQTIIKVSRGCPHHCFFCLATPVSGALVRYRSAKNIVEEIKECVNKYGIKNFIFWSDIFTQNKQWVKALCELIINSNLNITFSANTRADTTDLQMAILMKQAGCSLVSIGVESGSQRMLDAMGKKITLKQIEKTVKIFKKAKIKIYNYFVIGLPWEDEKSVKNTIRFAIKLNSDFVNFYTATALVGTRFYDYIQENDLDDELNYDKPYYFPSVKTHYLSKKRVFELHKKAFKKYYLRPRYILKMLFSIKSKAEFKNYFKAGMRILTRKG